LQSRVEKQAFQDVKVVTHIKDPKEVENKVAIPRRKAGISSHSRKKG